MKRLYVPIAVRRISTALRHLRQISDWH